MITDNHDCFCMCPACDYETIDALCGIDEAYPDGHYTSYCAICDEVDCSNPNHD